MNFATLQGLTIPEGVVTQIADASGNVIWKLVTNKPVILQVEKFTSDTYAGETTYTGEQFILLDIYPKTNGTVNVTYGGLTKTITDTSGAAEPNAQQVFFGTFNGVSDSVATPASGTLTIEGDYRMFGTGLYAQSNKTISGVGCSCIVEVVDFGDVTMLPENAFDRCTKMTSIIIPEVISELPFGAFQRCTGLTSVAMHNGITSIGNAAFNNCTNLALTSLPSGITSIGPYAFQYCENINIQTFPEGLESIGDYAFDMDSRSKTAMRNGTIILPSTLQSIGAFAFCTDETSDSSSSLYYGYLKTIKMLGTVPPTLGRNAFGQGSVEDIFVRAGYVDTYKNGEGWGEYSVDVKEGDVV